MKVIDIRDRQRELIAEREQIMIRMICAKCEYQKLERKLHKIDEEINRIQSN